MFDSHCHLSADAFDGDLGETLARAKASGVRRMVTVASDVDDSAICVDLAAAHSDVWCSVGIHPHEAGAAQPGDLSRIRDFARSAEYVVAIGETGLDFHYDHSPARLQRDLFVGQLELAEELGLPVIVHTRSADEDTIAILRDAPTDLRIVLHCFTGGPELLSAGLERGCYVSYSGIVTFKKFDAREAVCAVPSQRLLVETDSPYLAPEPQRGRRNEPAFLRHTIVQMAAIRGETEGEVAEYTERNAMQFYALDSEQSAVSQGHN